MATSYMQQPHMRLNALSPQSFHSPAGILRRINPETDTDHCKDFQLGCIRVTQRVFYKKQKLITLREHRSSSRFFFCGPCSSFFLVCFCVVLLCSEFCVLMSVTISAYKRCSVRLYLQLFVGGLMSFYVIGVCLRIVQCFSSSQCVPNVAIFSGLSIFFIVPSVFCNVQNQTRPMMPFSNTKCNSCTCLFCSRLT